MSDFSCDVFKIEKIEKHDNADTLSIVDALGFPCIIKTTDFKVGDLAIYIPVEALIPEDKEWVKKYCSHLKFKNGVHRLRAVRLRGVFSMGMVVPIDALGPGPTPGHGPFGTDVSQALGIVKYEEPERFVPSPPKPKTLWGRIKLYVKKLLGIKPPKPVPMLHVYGVDQYRKYKNTLELNKNVVVTEKVHGCLPPGTRISMADGSPRMIKKVKVGEYVLGQDENGKVVSAKVLAVHDNGHTKEWMNIKTEAIGMGRGNYYKSLTCTPNHEILTQRGYITASELKSTDEIFAIRTDFDLNPIQEDILIGKMLGDASKDAHGNAMTWGHKKEHLGYIKWIQKCLGGLCNPHLEEIKSGYGTKMVRNRTCASANVEKIIKRFFPEKNGIKQVPKDIALTPISLAFWYMDDGSLSHHESQLDRANFATCSFTQEECSYLQNALLKLGIKSEFYQDKTGYNRLRVNSDAAERMFLLIAPYVPKCMQYKLPERYRGHEPWIPSVEYKPPLVKQKIVSITKSTIKTTNKRDLTTETHNYFANGILVHNSNASFYYLNGDFRVASHNTVRRVEDNSAFWRAARQYDLKNKLKNYPDLAFFGEVYGPSIQDMGYGLKNDEIKLAFFDIMRISNRQFLNYDEACKILDEIGLPKVPLIYRGPYIPEQVEPLVEGKSLIPGANHNREGFVIQPEVERINPRIGRVKLKFVSQWYLLRKDGSEFH